MQRVCGGTQLKPQGKAQSTTKQHCINRFVPMMPWTIPIARGTQQEAAHTKLAVRASFGLFGLSEAHSLTGGGDPAES
jgi:hypothetical protein